MKLIMKYLLYHFLTIPFLLCFSGSVVAQCQLDEESSSWGYGAVSMFYSNPYYEDRRMEMGVSSLQNQIDIDDIYLLDEEARCNELQSHISTSSDIPESRKNQSNVVLVDDNAQRYFIVFYSTPAQPGFSTVVYILDFNLHKLGAFGV